MHTLGDLLGDCLILDLFFDGALGLRHSPLAMMVKSIDAFVAVSTMSAPFVHVKLAKKAEGLIGGGSSCCFTLQQKRG